jgi:transcriptional regulator with XRE-family HTH domain
MAFGDRLKIARERLNLSRDVLAQKLGLSYSAIAKYESNDRFPDDETLVKMSETLNVSTDYLFGRTNAFHAIAEFDESFDHVRLDDIKDEYIAAYEQDPVRKLIKNYVENYLKETRDKALENPDLPNKEVVAKKIDRFIENHVYRLASRAYQDLKMREHDYIKSNNELPQTVAENITNIINSEMLSLLASVTQPRKYENPIDRAERIKKELIGMLNPERYKSNSTSEIFTDPNISVEYNGLSEMTPEIQKDIERIFDRIKEIYAKKKPEDPPVREFDITKLDEF